MRLTLLRFFDLLWFAIFMYVADYFGRCICYGDVFTLLLLPRGGVYHPNHTLNDKIYISGESYTGLCLAILQ